MTWPCSPSGTAVRNTKSLSFRAVIAGAVDDGEICTTPFGMVTLLATGMVEPEAIAPISAEAFST